jgi:Sec-independent protein translocase protein TatA
MKVKVLRMFADKFNLTHSYQPGEVQDFEEARANDIVARGLGEFVKEETKETERVVPEQEVESEHAPEVEETKAEVEKSAETEESKAEEEETAPEAQAEDAGESPKPKRGRPKKSE